MTKDAYAAGRAQSLSIIVPAYNEEARLPALLQTLGSEGQAAVAAGGFEFLEAVIVDDGSGDRTPELLSRAAEADSRVRPVLGDGRNRGKGAAVAAGVRAAEGELVLLADVDLSTPLSDLAKLGAAVREGADMAIGSRVMEGSVVENAPLRRRHLGKMFNLVVRGITGLPYRDTQCGFKLMGAETARELLQTQISSGFAFDVELLMRARLADLQVAEVPVTYVHDPRSQVRVASASVGMVLDVVRVARRLRSRRLWHAPAQQAERDPGRQPQPEGDQPRLETHRDR